MTEIKINKTPFGGQIGGAVQIVAPEFTHLPKEGTLPLMARITIEYAPRENTLDGDDLGGYFASFRDVRLTPEEAVQQICDELCQACEPMMMNVTSNYTPRAGIGVHPQARFMHPEAAKQQSLIQRP